MAKIVYNACYGGFGISEQGILHYAKLKGIELYPEKNIGIVTYWTIPYQESCELGILSSNEFQKASSEERKKSNELYSKYVFDYSKISRSDPCFVQMVEDLGDKANGHCAKLEIEEVPTGTLYRIEEYDGFESVVLAESEVWEIA